MWLEVQQFNPSEKWQYSDGFILSESEYFLFEWSMPNDLRLRNYIGQSGEPGAIFGVQTIVSSKANSTILFMPNPPIWSERKLCILCPKIWVGAIPEYKVTVSKWQQ